MEETDSLVRMKTGFELLSDINGEIAELCHEKSYLTTEYNIKIRQIDERLEMLRQTADGIRRELAEKEGWRQCNKTC